MISTDISNYECPVCFEEELSSTQLVYTDCCFHKVCNVCDQALKLCPHCRTEWGELRIRFGSYSFIKNYSNLRLSSGNHTVVSVIETVERFFPFIETQLTNRLLIKVLGSNGHYKLCFDEIDNGSQYFLENMRFPHDDLTDNDISGWIMVLLTSGKTLTKNKLTKEEIHRICNSYASKLIPHSLSQDYIDVCINRLVEGGFCYWDESQILRYIF